MRESKTHGTTRLTERSPYRANININVRATDATITLEQLVMVRTGDCGLNTARRAGINSTYEAIKTVEQLASVQEDFTKRCKVIFSTDGWPVRLACERANSTESMEIVL